MILEEFKLNSKYPNIGSIVFSKKELIYNNTVIPEGTTGKVVRKRTDNNLLVVNWFYNNGCYLVKNFVLSENPELEVYSQDSAYFFNKNDNNEFGIITETLQTVVNDIFEQIKKHNFQFFIKRKGIYLEKNYIFVSKYRFDSFTPFSIVTLINTLNLKIKNDRILINRLNEWLKTYFNKEFNNELFNIESLYWTSFFDNNSLRVIQNQIIYKKEIHSILLKKEKAVI